MEPSQTPASTQGHPDRFQLDGLALTAFFDALPQGAVLAEPPGRIVEANPAACRILDLDREELLAWDRTGDPLRILAADGSSLPPDEHPLAVTFATGAAAPPRTLGWRRGDGEIRWLECDAVPLADGKALCTFSDVTPFRRQSDHLERMTQLYAALSQVNQTIVFAPNRESLLASICSVMVEFGKFSMAWIGWEDPETRELQVVSSAGDRMGYLDHVAVRTDDTPLGQGGSGRAIREGRSVVINDFAGSPELGPWHEAAARSGFAASASIPIRERGTVRGALMVYAPEKQFFGEHELALLEEAAGDIAYGLENLELDFQRRKAELALRESEEALREREYFFRESQRAGAIGSYKTDFTTGRWESSEVLDEIFGIGPEYQRSVQGWVDLVHPDDRAMMDRYLREEVLGRGKPFLKSYRIIRQHDGATRWVSGRGVLEFDARGQASALIGTIRDITDRKRLEKARQALLQISEAAQALPSLEELLSRVHQIVGELLPARNFYVCLAEEGTGMLTFPFFADELDARPPARKPGRTLTDRVLSTGRAHLLRNEDLQALVDAGTVEINGTWPKVWLGVPLMGPEGPFGVLAVQSYQDQARYAESDVELLQFVSLQIAASILRKQAERENRTLQGQLVQAQKMESLGILAGGVAHDMNNVLGAILALASVNLVTQPEGSPVHQAFDTIAEAATRGGKLVKSLLTFARQNPVEMRELDLNQILREEVRLLERTTLAKVNLELDLGEALPPVQGDGNALVHAFMNLCVNAVDAMPERGTLTLRTRDLEDGWVEALVEDTGTGMPSDVLEKALDPFFTTKEVGKGTGLGLSMVYATVKAHKGRMTIESEPGAGTKVRLRFPASAAGPAAPPEAAGSGDLARLGKLRILFVDDDDLVLRSSQQLMRALGLTATFVPSGEEALAAIEAGFRPDLVILDLNMPGLGGAGTLPLLRGLCPEVPVLLTTGRVDETAMALLRANQHLSLLPKPFSLADLQAQLGKVEAGLSRKRGS